MLSVPKKLHSEIIRLQPINSNKGRKIQVIAVSIKFKVCNGRSFQEKIDRPFFYRYYRY